MSAASLKKDSHPHHDERPCTEQQRWHVFLAIAFLVAMIGAALAFSQIRRLDRIKSELTRERAEAAPSAEEALEKAEAEQAMTGRALNLFLDFGRSKALMAKVWVGEREDDPVYLSRYPDRVTLDLTRFLRDGPVKVTTRVVETVEAAAPRSESWKVGLETRALGSINAGSYRRLRRWDLTPVLEPTRRETVTENGVEKTRLIYEKTFVFDGSDAR